MGRSLQPPIELIFAWQTNAYPHGVRRGWGLAIEVAVLGTLTFAVVLVRLYARLKKQRNPGLDDVIIVPALLITTAMNICVAYSGGLHEADLDAADSTSRFKDSTIPAGVATRKITFAISFLYVWGTGLTKISVLLFYRRLACSLPIPFLYAVYFTLAYVAIYVIAFSFSLLFTCNPIKAYWMEVDLFWVKTNKFKCTDEGAALMVTNSISITQDFLACILPALLFWNLQVTRRQKIAMGMLLGVSIFPCVAGIIRFYFLHRAVYTTYDIPWEMYPMWVWTLIEANFGLICASVPALKIFFKRALQLSRYGKKSTGNTDSSKRKYFPHKSSKSGLPGFGVETIGGSGGTGRKGSLKPQSRDDILELKDVDSILEASESGAREDLFPHTKISASLHNSERGTEELSLV